MKRAEINNAVEKAFASASVKFNNELEEIYEKMIRTSSDH